MLNEKNLKRKHSDTDSDAGDSPEAASPRTPERVVRTADTFHTPPERIKRDSATVPPSVKKQRIENERARRMDYLTEQVMEMLNTSPTRESASSSLPPVQASSLLPLDQGMWHVRRRLDVTVLSDPGTSTSPSADSMLDDAMLDDADTDNSSPRPGLPK